MTNKHSLVRSSFLFLTALCFAACAFKSSHAQEFKSIFDGKSMAGWSGDTSYWKIDGDTIVGESTAENPLKRNIFLTWEHEIDDFELRLKFRISGTDRANSGIQFRSQMADDGHLMGYQADIDRSGTYIGILYDEKTGRGILCNRGDQVTIGNDGKKNKTGSVGDKAELLSKINLDGWNDYAITAVGNKYTIKINGHTMSETTDDHAEHFDRKGLLGLQLHAGPPMKIEFRDLYLKRLPLSNGEKKVVLVAGKPSHAPGQHEHNAGCLLLADKLETAAAEHGLPIVTTVYRNGWPSDPTAFDNADTVVSYCDGGGRHYLHEEGEVFEDIMRRGVGLVCIHYGVEVPKGISGQRFLNWIGGYFETNWSVNPHWDAKFDNLPDHPVTNGVTPFEIRDEWYYHMRFAPEMTRVTPVLTAMPPKESLSRKDGPHSGNPDVRKAILEDKQPQHLAWAFVRGDGKGRGFGFTGGHFHRNWRNDQFRKVVLNAIVWTAHLEVPEAGVPSATPTKEEMAANQDPKPQKKKKAG